MMTFEVKVFDTVGQFEDYLNRKQVSLDKLNICYSSGQILVTVQNGEVLSEQGAGLENKVDTLGAVLDNESVFCGKNGTCNLKYFNRHGDEIYTVDICKIDFNTPVLRKHQVEDGLWHIVLDTSCVGRMIHGFC